MSATTSIMGELSAGVMAMLKAQTWSFPFKLERSYRPINEVEDVACDALVTVVPGLRRVQWLNRAGNKRHDFVVKVTLQERHGDNGPPLAGDPGEIGPADRCDAIANRAQELEDFLLTPSNRITLTSGKKASPWQAEIEIDDERLEELGILAVDVLVTYRLMR